MSGKIVNDGEMVFLDDIVIFEEEILKPFNLPRVPIFSNDELTIFYGGQIYLAQELTATEGDRIKIYTQRYKLEKIASPQDQESAWFAEHATTISQLQKEFIARCVDGIDLGSSSSLGGVLGHQISAELVERIEQTYVSTDKDRTKIVQAIHGDSTMFNTLPANEHSLILDGKIYNLITIGEYVSGFEKAFEPDFFQTLMKFSKTKGPEEIARELNANTNKISSRAIFFIRDKIWNGEGSFEINIGGNYLVPQYVGEVQPVIDEYSSRLREKIKHDAVKIYK